ncbi:hypothetical protein [Burkholderia cenocepacia]|uniref:hypothetical protein n=1 Tax=Burkholderia cenocepacia TaxID=95486 RepID=UPI000F5A3AF4|nr:hypothetical protein [Burkholderia cenocepacia]
MQHFFLKNHVKKYATVTGRDSFFITSFDVLRAAQSVGVFNDEIERSNLYPAIARADASQLEEIISKINGSQSPRSNYYMEMQIHNMVSLSDDMSRFMVYEPSKEDELKIEGLLRGFKR